MSDRAKEFIASVSHDAEVIPVFRDWLLEHPEELERILRLLFGVPYKRAEDAEDERLARTEFVVEEDGDDYMHLWRVWSAESDWNSATFPVEKLSWVDDSMGRWQSIGEIGGHVVGISLRWATISGHLVLFVSCTSRVWDWQIVEGWLDRYCNPKTRDGRSARCNAANFHHCVEYCRGE